MKISVSKKALIIALSITASCEGFAGEVMNAEFRTMHECLAGIKKFSKLSLKVITDEPSKVSGFLSNGEFFACEKEESGTKGTYYHGWYTVK